MTEKTTRIVWADVLRLIAIFMVISIHCADPFNVSPEARSNPEYNLWGSIYGAFLRPCVPLFVMLTGLLLLPIKQGIGQFYHKRLLRVVVPFAIWSLLYNIFPWVTGVLGLDSSVLSVMFPYAGENPSQTIESCLHNILMIPFNFNTYTVPLWYIYMLIGLYLYMPFFSAWVKQASEKQKKIFLSIWFVSLFLPYCQEYITAYIGGTCAWNDFGILYYFSGFSGYLLLGHYLKDKRLLPKRNAIALSLACLAVGYAITYYGFRTMTAQPDITERQVELFFLYCSPPCVLNGFGMVFNRAKNGNKVQDCYFCIGQYQQMRVGHLHGALFHCRSRLLCHRQNRRIHTSAHPCNCVVRIRCFMGLRFIIPQGKP